MTRVSSCYFLEECFVAIIASSYKVLLLPDVFLSPPPFRAVDARCSEPFQALLAALDSKQPRASLSC